jgi:hypothetical protein
LHRDIFYPMLTHILARSKFSQGGFNFLRGHGRVSIPIRYEVLVHCPGSLLLTMPLISTRSPLYLAARNRHAAVTKQLIEARCNIDLQDKDGAKKSDTPPSPLAPLARKPHVCSPPCPPIATITTPSALFCTAPTLARG